MNINRHNYEEYFLMYADNELTQADRSAVEAFVQHNPDLSKELELLQQSVLMPDEDVQFPAKDILYRNELSVCIDNYQEYFLLYVDNELTAKEKDDVEKFVLQHPKLQDEFTVLQQTKLTPEQFEFKDKALLYKTTVRRIVPLAWMGMAAAAVIIGLVAMLWLTYTGNIKTAQSVAINKTKTGVVKPESTQPAVPVKVNVAPAEQIAAAENPVNKEVRIEKKEARFRDVQQVATTTKENKKSQAIDPGNLNQLPVPENNPSIARNNPKRDNDPQTTTEERTSNNYGTSSGIVAAKNSTAETAGSLINHAVYKEIDNDNEEDKTLYIGGAEINKSKLRGLFKKAAILFDKKIKKNDNGNIVQIAGFEIKTK